MDENEVIQPETRRDMLEASFDNIEQSANDQTMVDRARDEQGRFAAKQEEVKQEIEANPQPETPQEQQMTQRELKTWRKEFRPIQEKLGRGEVLTPDEAKKLYEYNFERESQYAAGVAAHKGEAEQAKELTKIVNEFMPVLQKSNISPTQWLQGLGEAHRIFVMGNPEEKLQMFSRLAQEYGVPLASIQQAQQGQYDPVAMQLMQELQNLKQSYGDINNWRQQQENIVVQKELAKFTDAAKYPHFDQVREDMALLLEAGRAQDLDDAYAKAVRLSDDAWKAEQERQAQFNQASQQQAKAAVLAKAKASSGQVKSATPSTIIPAQTAKDRRGQLASAFDEIASPGRV